MLQQTQRPAIALSGAVPEPPSRGALEWARWLLVGGGARTTRLRTLTLIRWMAIVGQAFAISFVHFSLAFPLPLIPLAAAVTLSTTINLALSIGCPANTRLTERSVALLLCYDVLQLAFLLALTGGLQNPFAFLLIVPVTLSATTLSLRTTVGLCLLVIVLATGMAVYPSTLPWSGSDLRLPGLYVLGIWLALVLSATLSAGYAWRVADEGRRLSDALAATQMALAREQRLSALGGLAAAAAHDLGSPLATITVTARELANSIPDDSPLADDIDELVGQSRRCREILSSLAQQLERDDVTPFTKVPLSALLGTIVENCARPAIETEVQVEYLGAAGEPVWAPTPELNHALTNLIDNAMGFARTKVTIVVELDGEIVRVRIKDDGPGFDPEVLELLGEPYISTRRASGGLGLGVFIAETLLARTGATLHFDNLEVGACVTVTWRLTSGGNALGT